MDKDCNTCRHYDAMEGKCRKLNEFVHGYDGDDCTRWIHYMNEDEAPVRREVPGQMQMDLGDKDGGDRMVSVDAIRKAVEREFDMQDVYLPVHFLELVEYVAREAGK